MPLRDIKKSSNNISVAHVLYVLIEKLLIAIVSNNSTRKIAKKQTNKKISNKAFPFLLAKARILKWEGWESRRFMLAFYCIFFWKRPPLMFHLSYQNGGKILKYSNADLKSLPALPSLHKNNVPNVSHYNTFYFLRYARPKYAKCLFTKIRK